MQALASPGIRVATPAAAGHGPQSVWAEQITGRYRRISVQQLCMAWWLYAEGHITRRALRVYFAVHEMAERREYSAARANFSIEELKCLVGGRGSVTAEAALSADVRRLGQLGLVKLERHGVEFAQNIEELQVEDVAGFARMLEQMPHPRRIVPVPRRTLRALAAGFGRGVMAVMIATMIRSLFWHRGETMPYRVDGRTKGSWIAQVFGVSRRAVSNARTRLTELGWIEPVPSQQWELNRWGAHDRIVTDWSPDNGQLVSVESREGKGTAGPSENASPPPTRPAGIASPDLNSSASSNEEELTTRRPRPVSDAHRQTSLVSREISTDCTSSSQVSLQDIRSKDLADTEAVMELYDQAQEAGLSSGDERGKLEFVAMVERARAHGRRPGALFTWLLRERRSEFITQADEDRAIKRLREYRHGSRVRRRTSPAGDLVLSKEEAVVRVCLLVAKKYSGVSPETLAGHKYGWTPEEWNRAQLAYEVKERSRYREVLRADAGCVRYLRSVG